MASASFSPGTWGPPRRPADLSTSSSVFDGPRRFFSLQKKNRNIGWLSSVTGSLRMWCTPRVLGREPTTARSSSGSADPGHPPRARALRASKFWSGVSALLLLYLATRIEQRDRDGRGASPCQNGFGLSTRTQKRARNSHVVWGDVVILAEAGKVELSPPPPRESGDGGASDFGAPSHPLFGNVEGKNSAGGGADQRGSGVLTADLNEASLGATGQDSPLTKEEKGTKEMSHEDEKEDKEAQKSNQKKEAAVGLQSELPDLDVGPLKDGPISREALNALKAREPKADPDAELHASAIPAANSSLGVHSTTAGRSEKTEGTEGLSGSASEVVPTPSSTASQLGKETQTNEVSAGASSENVASREDSKNAGKLAQQPDSETKDSSRDGDERGQRPPGVSAPGSFDSVKAGGKKEDIGAPSPSEKAVHLTSGADEEGHLDKQDKGLGGAAGSGLATASERLASKQHKEEGAIPEPRAAGDGGGEEISSTEASTLGRKEQQSKHPQHQRTPSRSKAKEAGEKTDSRSKGPKQRRSDEKQKHPKRASSPFQKPHQQRAETKHRTTSSDGQDFSSENSPEDVVKHGDNIIPVRTEDIPSASPSAAESSTRQEGEQGADGGGPTREPRGSGSESNRYDSGDREPRQPASTAVNRLEDSAPVDESSTVTGSPSSRSPDSPHHSHPPPPPPEDNRYDYDQPQGQPYDGYHYYDNYGQQQGREQNPQEEQHRRKEERETYSFGGSEKAPSSYHPSASASDEHYQRTYNDAVEPPLESVVAGEDAGLVGIPTAAAGLPLSEGGGEGGGGDAYYYGGQYRHYGAGGQWRKSEDADGDSAVGGEESLKKMTKYDDHTETQQQQQYNMYETEDVLQTTLQQHCDAWCTAEALKYWDESRRPIWASLHLQPVPSFFSDLRSGLFVLFHHHAPQLQALRLRVERGVVDTAHAVSVASKDLRASHPSLWLFLVYLLVFLLLSRLITGRFIPPCANPFFWLCRKRRERQKEMQLRQDTAQAVVEKLLEQQQIKWLLTQTKKTSFVCERLKGTLSQVEERVSSDTIRISSSFSSTPTATGGEKGEESLQKELLAAEHKMLQTQQDQIRRIFSILQRQEDRQNRLFDELQEQQRAAEETREIQLRRILAESKKQFDAAAFQQTQYSLVFLQALGRIICAVDPAYSPEEKERLEASITAYHQALQNTHHSASSSFENLDDDVSLKGGGGGGEDPFNQLLNTTGLTPRVSQTAGSGKKDGSGQAGGGGGGGDLVGGVGGMMVAGGVPSSASPERGAVKVRRGGSDGDFSQHETARGLRSSRVKEGGGGGGGSVGEDEGLPEERDWEGRGFGGIEENGGEERGGERRRSSFGGKDESAPRGSRQEQSRHHRGGVVPSGLFGSPPPSSSSPPPFNESPPGGPALNGDFSLPPSSSRGLPPSPGVASSQHLPPHVPDTPPLMMGSHTGAADLASTTPDSSSSAGMLSSRAPGGGLAAHHTIGSSPPPPAPHASSSSQQNTPNGVSPPPPPAGLPGSSPYGLGAGVPGSSHPVMPSSLSSSPLPHPSTTSALNNTSSSGFYLPPGSAEGGGGVVGGVVAPGLMSATTASSHLNSNSTPRAGLGGRLPAPPPQGLKDPFASSPPPSTDDIEGRGSSAGTSRSGSTTLQAAVATAAVAASGRGGGGLMGSGSGTGAGAHTLQSSSFLPSSSYTSTTTVGGGGGAMPGSNGVTSPSFGSVSMPPVIPTEEGGGGGLEGGGGAGFGLLPRRISSTSSHTSDRLSTFSSNDMVTAAGGGGGEKGGVGGAGGRYGGGGGGVFNSSRPPSGGRGSSVSIGGAGEAMDEGGLAASPPPPVGLTNGLVSSAPQMNTTASPLRPGGGAGGGGPSPPHPQDAAAGQPSLSVAGGGGVAPPPGGAVYPPATSSRPPGRIVRERREPPKIQAATNPFGFAPPPSASLSATNNIDA